MLQAFSWAFALWYSLAAGLPMSTLECNQMQAAAVAGSQLRAAVPPNNREARARVDSMSPSSGSLSR